MFRGFKSCEENLGADPLHTTHKNIKGVMLDMNGVLVEMGCNGVIALPGAVEAVQRLKDNGIVVRFVSNCTQKDRLFIDKILKRMKFPINVENIITPAPVVRHHIIQNHLRPYLLIHEDSYKDFEGLDTENPNCVVLGDAQKDFSFEKLNRAFQILISNPSAELLALGSGKFYKLSEGLTMDVGPFMKALEFATGKEATIIGKPNPAFFKDAIDDMSLNPNEIIMIGDDYDVDFHGSSAVNVQAIIVKTGKLIPQTTDPGLIVAENVGDAVDLIIRHNDKIKHSQ